MSVPNSMAELHAGASHSEATAHPCLPLITRALVHIFTITTCTCPQQRITIKAEPQHAIQQPTDLFICTLRHGGSTEPALPTIEIIGQREREEEQPTNPSSVHI